MTRQEFSKIIADYRKANRMSVSKMCTDTGININMAYRMESGKSPFSIKNYLKYMDAGDMVLTIGTPGEDSARIPDYASLKKFLRVMLNKYCRDLRSSVVALCSAIIHAEETAPIDTLLRICDAVGLSLGVASKEDAQPKEAQTVGRMTRQEFSKMIAGYRKAMGLSMKFMCFNLDWHGDNVRTFEQGKYNYNLQRCLKYLDVVGLSLTISGVEISDYDSLVSHIVGLRHKNRYSKRALSKAAGYSNSLVSFFESKKPPSLLMRY